MNSSIFPCLAITKLARTEGDMKLLYTSLLTILTTSMINGVQGQCFFATCAVDDSIVSGSGLVAICATESGGTLQTELNLDLCFWNDNGVLEAGSG